jgi:hypothetical protein
VKPDQLVLSRLTASNPSAFGFAYSVLMDRRFATAAWAYDARLGISHVDEVGWLVKGQRANICVAPHLDLVLCVGEQ